MKTQDVLKRYELLKEETRRFSYWGKLDAFMKELAEQLETSDPVESVGWSENGTRKSTEQVYDFEP